MAAENQVDVNIKLTADTKGGAEAEKSVKNVGKAAKESESTGKSAASGLKAAYEGFGNTVNKVGKIVGSFTKALGLIGFAVAAIQGIIAAYQKLQEWLHKDEIAAAKLREEIEKKNYEESVARVTRNYEQLNQQVAENLRLEQQKNALIDERTRMERSNEDARLRLGEAKEIAALDQDDPDYANKANLIKQNYARKRADLQEQRATADNRTEVARLYKAAEEKDKEATELRKQIDWGSDAKRNLINKRAEYNEAEIAARGGDEKSKERIDAARKEYEEAKAAYNKIKQAAEAAEKAAQELRNQAANKTGANLAAKINNQAAQVEIDTQEKQTRRSIENDRKNREEQAVREKDRKAKEAEEARKKDEKTAAEAAKIADAEAAHKALMTQKADIHSQIAAEQRKKDAAAFQVYNAQGTMDAARLGGNRSAQQSAFANLQAAQIAAQNVNFAADKAINALTATLKNVGDKLNQVDHVIKLGRKQQQNFVSEAPAGE